MTSASTTVLPFEEPVRELERQIESLEARDDAADIAEEITSLRNSRNSLLQKIYGNLSAWDIVRIARHPERPQTPDYIHMICRDFP